MGEVEFFHHTGPGYGITRDAVPFTPSIFISPGVTMKYTATPQSGTSWAATTFSDASWSTGNAGSFPTVTTTTRYYRYTVPITVAGYFALNVGVRTNSGFIIYINGQEAHRVGLASGTISSSSISTLAESTPTWKSVTVSTQLFITSGNSVTIAVEVHLGPGQSNIPDVFDIRGFIYSGTGTSSPPSLIRRLRHHQPLLR